MPTYEYRCKACGHEFERFQSISASPVRTCPSCKKRRVERLISAGGGLVFKGPGFYATDYKKAAPSSASSDSGDAGDGGAEKKADAASDGDGGGPSKSDKSDSGS